MKSTQASIVADKVCALSAFITGSQVYGFPSEKSDWDVCVSYLDLESATNWIVELGGSFTEQSNYNDGTKYTFNDDSVINLIPLHHMDLLYWALATREMEEMKISGYYEESLRDKKTRHSLFELKRTTFKLAMRLVEFQESLNMLKVIKGVK